MTRTAAIGLITFYQRYLSPWKGFCCAHRVLHGGPSCSEFAKRVVSSHGVLKMFFLLRKRFARCAAAAKKLGFHERMEKIRARKEKKLKDASHDRKYNECLSRVGLSCIVLEGGCAVAEACGGEGDACSVFDCGFGLL